MLRTTISKIKRVCTLMYLPRFGRGNLGYSPNRFAKLSLAHIRTAENSTKSGSNIGKEEDEHCEKCKKIIELAFGPSKNIELQITKKDQTPEDIMTPELQLQMQDISRVKTHGIVTSQVHIKQENQCEKCQRIIHEIFDTDLPNKEAVERMNEVQIKDMILQATTAKENEEKLTQKIETIEEIPLVEAAKPKLEGFNLTPKVLGDTVDMNCSEHCKESNIAHYKDCIEKSVIEENPNLNYPSYQFNYFEQTQTSGVRPDVGEKLKNKQTKSLDKKEFVSHTHVEPICIVPNRYHQNANHNQYNYQQQHYSFPNSQDNVYNQENNNLDNKKIKTDKSLKDHCYNVSEDSEKNRKTGSTKADVQISIDELAKKCLNSPSNRIDEHLLKEMEKLAVPQTETKASGTHTMNDVIQMDLRKKTTKPIEKNEKDVETRMIDKDVTDVKNDCAEKLYPPYEANHLEKEIIKQDLETSELKYEKLIHNFNYNLLNIEEESKNKEQMPINTTNSIQTDNITDYENKLVADSIHAKSENTSDKVKEILSKDTSHTTATYVENITDLYNKQLDESTDIKLNTIEKSQEKLSIQPTNNNVNATSYKALQDANSTHLQNKLGYNLNHIKSENIAKSINPIVNGNEFLLDTTKTHYEKIMQILGTRQSFDPNQVLIEPFDKKTLSRDVGKFDFDHKTLDVMNVSEYKNQHTEEGNKSRLLKHGKEEKHAGLLLAAKETSSVSAHEHSPPVTTVKISRLKPCSDIDVDNVDLPQMIYIDKKSDPTQHTCNVQDANVPDHTESEKPTTTSLERNDSKDDIDKKSDILPGVLQLQEVCDPKPSEINTDATAESKVINVTNIPKDNTQIASIQKPLENYTETIQISSETLYTERATSAENELQDDKQDTLIKPQITSQNKMDPKTAQNIVHTSSKEDDPKLAEITKNNRFMENIDECKTEDMYTSSQSVRPTDYTNPNHNSYGSYYDSHNQINNNPKQPGTIEIDRKNEEHPKSTEQISHSFRQPEAKINRNRLQSNLSSLGPLPKLKDEKLTLSQLLRRIRERNKMKECKEFEEHTLSIQTKVNTLEGKCGDKTPTCPPPAPQCPPKNPCPPPPCPPPPPPCPKPCKPKCPQPCPPPKKKNPCDKYTKKCYGTLKDMIQILLLGQKLPTLTEKAYLSADIVAKLRTLRLILKALQFQGRFTTVEMELCTDSRQKVTGMIMARDFEPWTPIPSWPIPKKEKKRPLACPKEGCKAVPAVTPNLNLPYRPKHCPGFPKRTFSIPGLLSSEVYEKKVFDLGYF